MAKAKKKITPRRTLTRMEKVEMMQTGRKPASWPRPKPNPNRKKS